MATEFLFLPMRRVALVLALLTPAFADDAIVFVIPHGDSFTWTEGEAKAMFENTSLFESFDAAELGFNVSYADEDVGFADPETGPLARETFRQVLGYVASTLNFRNRTLDIYVRPSQTDGQNFLAAAGTGYPNSPGIHPGGMLHRLITGEKLGEDVPEMVLTIDFGRPWAFADEEPDPEKFDLYSTLLHEVVHALGFSSRISRSGTSIDGTGAYSVYDTFLTDRTSGALLISRNPVLPFFAGTLEMLTTNSIGFSGRHVLASFDQGIPVPVFSRYPFSAGSSLSHWEFDILPGGTLMDPGSAPGEILREFSSVDFGAIRDLIERAKATEGPGIAGCAMTEEQGEGPLAPLGDWLLVVVLFIGLTIILSPAVMAEGNRKEVCDVVEEI